MHELGVAGFRRLGLAQLLLDLGVDLGFVGLHAAAGSRQLLEGLVHGGEILVIDVDRTTLLIGQERVELVERFFQLFILERRSLAPVASVPRHQLLADVQQLLAGAGHLEKDAAAAVLEHVGQLVSRQRVAVDDDRHVAPGGCASDLLADLGPVLALEHGLDQHQGRTFLEEGPQTLAAADGAQDLVTGPRQRLSDPVGPSGVAVDQQNL